jgi:hypothetical protein
LYKTSATEYVEPIYTPANQKLLLDAWNYISVSLRTYLDKNTERYEQILAIA